MAGSREGGRMDGIKAYRQRILEAIGGFQKSRRKARRKAVGVGGKNQRLCNGNEHGQRIKNQKVGK